MFGKKKQPPPSNRPTGQVPRCSFCHKTQQDVRRLIAGPNVYICDECVDICIDIVTHDRKDDRRSKEANGAEVLSICSLCHLPTAVEQSTPIADRGILCPGCVGEIEAALARRDEPN